MPDDDYYIEIESKHHIELPSSKKKKKGIKKKTVNSLKIYFIILFIILVYLFYNQIILFFLSILQYNPTLYNAYQFLEIEIGNKTLKGLFFMAVFGSLFFLLLPSEALFIYYLSSTDYFFMTIILFMLVGNLAGMVFNYLFGFIMGEKIVKFLFGEDKFFEYKNKIDKWGGLVLFFGNIFPGPIEALAVFYGGFKFKFSRYVYLVLMGRLIKYVLIFLAYYFFWDQLIFFYEGLIDNVLILKALYL